ncbi:MAG: surface antigen [Verrucomicrobia bacterium]|nr:surface antigen [Verrucomicrobiota bacterium]
MNRAVDLARTAVIAAICLVAVAPVRAKASKPSKAKIEVSGLGWIHDRDQRHSLERLLGDQRQETLGANAIEDAAFLLVSALESEGYLKPVIEIELRDTSGAKQGFLFDATLASPLPRTLHARSVNFNVKEGTRSEITDLAITGLSAVPMRTAREYFVSTRTLLARGAARAYTPGKLRRAAESLQDDLRQRGYAEARVTAKKTDVDETGAKVAIAVDVLEGPRWEVSALTFAGELGAGVQLDFTAPFEHRPWTPLWQQEVRERIRRAFYTRGYPEATIALAAKEERAGGGIKPVTVVATIKAGPEVKVGQIRIAGNVRTQESVLRRRIRTKPGDPLNPIALERARYRLSRLGIFSAVDLEYEPADGALRDPVFRLAEAKPYETNLLLGYGSYEQLRAGIEFRQLNLFGLAHHSRLEFLQSMKSTSGEYNYTVPEIFGESVDGTARLFGLQRQEESFLRQEYGATIGLKRTLPWYKMEATTGYTYQALRNKDSQLSAVIPENSDVTVASLDFGLTSDHRDNPLRPRRGYRWFAQLEAASRALGGEADYQRVESGAAFHTSWGASRWIHLGLTNGIVTTGGAGNDLLLPVNKRFYPGGESSIRGYQSGEASPRGPDGKFIGAKSYVLGNVELEQALTPNWSVVLFGDGLGMSARLSSSLYEERLYSVGLGVRYQTLIGPLRVEYGHNLNPRVGDPSGTLHFSVGFPF